MGMGVDTLAVAAIAASVIGTGVAAYSAQQQGAAASQANRYQQQVAIINAQTAERNQALANKNAEYEAAAGAAQVDDQARRIRGTIGAQRAALASNGLLLDTGTAADLQDDTAELGGLAIGEIRDNSARRAAGYRISGMNAASEAQAATLRGQMYGDSASSASTAGWLGAGSSLLGGATRTFGMYADMQRSGVRMNNPPAVV